MTWCRGEPCSSLHHVSTILNTAIGIPYSGSSKRRSVADAFLSATGDIREWGAVARQGESNIYLAYCRDNMRERGILSRELVKETLSHHTNQYEKPANISYDKADNTFCRENLVPDADIDVRSGCRRAEELFELYQICVNRKHVEIICSSYLRSLEATKCEKINISHPDFLLDKSLNMV